MTRTLIVAYLLLSIFSLQSCKTREETGPTSECLFPGCKLPGQVPELFAPGIITGNYMTRDVAITPDGKEIYFGAHISKYYTILVTTRGDDGWTSPRVADHMTNPAYMNIEPAISFDGKRMYFLSDRPDKGEDEGDQDIWIMDREGDHWGEPYNAGPPLNTDLPEFFPGLTEDGTIYFTRNAEGTEEAFIYRSRMVDGQLQEAERLPGQVNCGSNRYNAFIAPNESYIIVPATGMTDSFGGTDYYIVFRDSADRWSQPINMGPEINTPDFYEYSAHVTRDGKWLFFMSRRYADIESDSLSFNTLKKIADGPESGYPSIYWMDASVIDSLRARAQYEL